MHTSLTQLADQRVPEVMPTADPYSDRCRMQVATAGVAGVDWFQRETGIPTRAPRLTHEGAAQVQRGPVRPAVTLALFPTPLHDRVEVTGLQARH